MEVVTVMSPAGLSGSQKSSFVITILMFETKCFERGVDMSLKLTAH